VICFSRFCVTPTIALNCKEADDLLCTSRHRLGLGTSSLRLHEPGRERLLLKQSYFVASSSSLNVAMKVLPSEFRPSIFIVSVLES